MLRSCFSAAQVSFPFLKRFYINGIIFYTHALHSLLTMKLSAPPYFYGYSWVHCFLSKTIPSYEFALLHLFILTLVNHLVVFSVGLWWITLLWALLYTFYCICVSTCQGEHTPSPGIGDLYGLCLAQIGRFLTTSLAKWLYQLTVPPSVYGTSHVFHIFLKCLPLSVLFSRIVSYTHNIPCLESDVEWQSLNGRVSIEVSL